MWHKMQQFAKKLIHIWRLDRGKNTLTREANKILKSKMLFDRFWQVKCKWILIIVNGGARQKCKDKNLKSSHNLHEKKRGSKLKIIFHAPFDILATTPRIQHSKSQTQTRQKKSYTTSPKRGKKKTAQACAIELSVK